jgi:hypothetical protein
MTISEAIEQVDRLKPNQYTQAEKIRWLSLLDGQFWQEIILTHEMPYSENFSGYSSDTDLSTELLVQAPYDVDIYVNYLQARIDRENAETAKYNQSITMYNSGYTAWVNYINRKYSPVINGNFLKF